MSPEARALKLRVLDTEDTDSTEEGDSVAEVVRLRSSLERCPKSHDFGDKHLFLRGVRVFRVQTAQLQKARARADASERLKSDTR